MARRYTVSTSYNLGTPSQANEVVLEQWVDLPVLLSQRLQRNVRQGQVVHLHKITASLTPQTQGSANNDIGVAFTGTVAHCPATKNSARAWREAFKVWRKQKQLRQNAVGSFTRFDDFEIGWNASFRSSSRTSTLYADGLSDTDSEKVVIYGASTPGDDITLEDIYESARGQAEPSRFPLSNAVVKTSKFVDEFPPPVKTPIHAHWSANSAQDGYDSGASVHHGVAYVQDSATLAGVLYVNGYMLPENTVGHIQDDVVLTLTFTVSLGTPLVLTQRKKRKALPRKSKGRRTKRKGRK